MVPDERRLADLRDPAGRPVVLLARIWDEKILRDHPELRGHLDEVIATVVAPDYIEADPRERRTRYYRRGGRRGAPDG